MSEIKSLLLRLGRALLNELESASKEPLPSKPVDDSPKNPICSGCRSIVLDNFCPKCGRPAESAP